MNGIDIYFQQLITFFYSITLFDKGLESFTVQSYGIHPDMNEHIAACFIGQGNSMTGRKQIFYHTVKRSHHNTVFRQDDHAFAQHLGGEFVRPRAHLLLEVLAEREVAEHLEERVVAGGVADVVKVVVLAAGADALLGRRGAGVRALVEAEEHVLELVHAGVREEKRRVMGGDDRARGDDRVALAFVEVQKGAANVCDFHKWVFGTPCQAACAWSGPFHLL